MKSQLMRIFKVLSCFIVASVVLLASVIMPAHAAVAGATQLSALLVSTTTVDGVTKSEYNFTIDGRPPYWKAFRDDKQIVNNHKAYNLSFPISGSGDTSISFHVSPLGYPADYLAGTPFPYGLVDVSDLKAFSQVQYSYVIAIDGVASNAGSTGGTYGSYISGQTDFYFYDEHGNYLSTVMGNRENYYPDSLGSQWLYNVRVNFGIPANAVYMAPLVRYSFNLKNLSGESNLTVSLDASRLYIDINSIMEDTLTMKAIEAQLGDISDKMDTVIDGTPEMNDQVQDDSQLQDELDQDLNNAMDDFDNKSDPDNILPDNSYSPEELEAITHDFSTSDAWRLVKQIFGRILADSGITDILMLVIGFINISVLLLGR